MVLFSFRFSVGCCLAALITGASADWLNEWGGEGGYDGWVEGHVATC